MTARRKNEDKALERVVRVHVSALAEDTQKEREVLFNRVFPQLRRMCGQLNVDLVALDMARYPVPGELSYERLLTAAFRQIDACRPYFLGILGERYGPVPQNVDRSLLFERSWIAQLPRASALELEFRHGVLRPTDSMGRALCYLRHAGYAERVPEDQRYRFKSEGKTASWKLSQLKDHLRQSGVLLRENYRTPAEFGEFVLADLWEFIRADYSSSGPSGHMALESMRQEAYAKSRSSAPLDRTSNASRLDRHIRGDEPPLVVVGDSGVGKATLLVELLEKAREDQSYDLILWHSAHDSVWASDPVKLVRRIIAEIKNRYVLPGDIPDVPQKLIEEFPSWLWAAASRGRTLLIVDGLDKLTTGPGIEGLSWLPEIIPPAVRVIFSMSSGPLQQKLAEREWPVHEVEALSLEASKKLAKSLCEDLHDPLAQRLSEAAANSPHAGNPLFLETVIGEIRNMEETPDYDDLIESYVKSESLGELYDKTLTRLERQYDPLRPNLLGDFLSQIWVSRCGVSESELLEMLGTKEEPLAAAIWSPLFLELRDHLVTRCGLVTFAHESFRDAVERRYLQDPEARRIAHDRAAVFYAGRRISDRVADELPWHLARIGGLEGFTGCITSSRMFSHLSEKDRVHDLIRYWEIAGANGDPVQACEEEAKSLEADERPTSDLIGYLENVGTFLARKGAFKEAEEFLTRAVTLREEEPSAEGSEIAESKAALADVLRNSGALDAAIGAYEQAHDIYQKALGQRAPETLKTLGSLASALRSKGRLEPAETYARQALESTEERRGPESPETADALLNLAKIQSDRGERDEAENLYRRALRIREKIWGPDHPETAAALIGLGSTLTNMARYEDAEPYLRRGLVIQQRSLGREHPETAATIACVADFARRIGDKDRARRLYMRALEIFSEAQGDRRADIARVLNRMALLLHQEGDVEGAEENWRKSVEILQEVLGKDHPETVAARADMTAALSPADEMEGTLELAKPEPFPERVDSRFEDTIDTAQHLDEEAAELNNKGDLDAAEPLCQEALALYERALGPDHPRTARSRFSLAVVLLGKMELQRAEELIKQALLVQTKKRPEHPETADSLTMLAWLLFYRGEYKEAHARFKEALKIREASLSPDHPAVGQSREHVRMIEARMKAEQGGAN